MNKKQQTIKCPACNTGIHRAGYIMEYSEEGMLVENVCGRCKGEGFVLIEIKLNKDFKCTCFDSEQEGCQLHGLPY